MSETTNEQESETRFVKMGIGTGIISYIDAVMKEGNIAALLSDPESFKNFAAIYLIGTALIETGNEDGDITDYTVQFASIKTGETLKGREA